MNAAFELIPITIEAKGEVIASNLTEVREMVREWLSNVNRDLTTDEDFGQAELDVKALKGAEERFQSAKEKALADAEALHALFKSIDETVEEIKAPRLELEKLIAKRKDEVKTEIVEEALATFDIDPKDARRKFLPGLQAAIKGKRTLDSMRQACRIYATAAQAKIGQCRQLLTRFEDTHGAEMTMDRRELELGDPDALEIELRRRFEARKAQREKQRLEEEAAKAKAEAEAAKKEAEAAKEPAKPAPLPEPPKIGGIQVGRTEIETAAQERKRFLDTMIQCFAPIKAARASLKHPENIEAASRFAGALGEAWAELNGRKETAA